MADGDDGILDHGDARGLSYPGEPMNIERLRELNENVLYPELLTYGRRDRARFLQEASKEPFDFLEWVGILAALVLVVSFTRYGVAGYSLGSCGCQLPRGRPATRGDRETISCSPHQARAAEAPAIKRLSTFRGQSAGWPALIGAASSTRWLGQPKQL